MAQKDVDFILSDVFPALRAAGLTSHIEAIKAVMRGVGAPPDEAFRPEPEPQAEPAVEQKRKK